MGGAGRYDRWRSHERRRITALALVSSAAVLCGASSASALEADASVPPTVDASVPPTVDAGVVPSEPPPACIDDALEPNNSTAEATRLTPGVRVEATACSGNVDLYRFPAPVAAGSLFLVTVGFTHALGDIDARLVSFSSGAVVAVSEGVFDNERLLATSDGGDYGLLVYLFGGGGNSYGVDVGAVVNQPESDCCTASGVPGCSVPAINECMCLTDVKCCADAFDDVCVVQAIAECGAECPRPAPVSDCCAASDVPGCGAPLVEACVCDIDPFCCGGRFDTNCVNLARAVCGAECSLQAP
jgi:hypothetical protein